MVERSISLNIKNKHWVCINGCLLRDGVFNDEKISPYKLLGRDYSSDIYVFVHKKWFLLELFRVFVYRRWYMYVMRPLKRVGFLDVPEGEKYDWAYWRWDFWNSASFKRILWPEIKRKLGIDGQ